MDARFKFVLNLLNQHLYWLSFDKETFCTIILIPFLIIYRNKYCLHCIREHFYKMNSGIPGVNVIESITLFNFLKLPINNFIFVNTYILTWGKVIKMTILTIFSVALTFLSFSQAGGKPPRLTVAPIYMHNYAIVSIQVFFL